MQILLPNRTLACLILTTLLSACAVPLESLPALGQAPIVAPTAPAPTQIPQPSATPFPSATPQPSATPPPTAVAQLLSPTATLEPLSLDQRNKIFQQIWELVRDRYLYSDFHGLDWNAVHDSFTPRVAETTTSEEFYALMHELLDQLNDAHTHFQSPQEVLSQQAQFSGEHRYGGIGAILHEVPEGGIITRVAQASPAEQAGIQPRDLIIAINSIPFTDTTAFGTDGPIGAIRGTPGTIVQLTIKSPGANPRAIPVTRQVIPSNAFPPVEARLLPNTAVGFLTINTFYAEGLDRFVRTELEKLLEKQPLEGLIINVRGNGGGRLDLMLKTLGLFIDGGSIGTSRGRDSTAPLDIPRNMMIAPLADVPIAVLIDSETASAAEMFVAGLQVLERARAIGVISAGNTENLLPHTLPGGSVLWLAERAYHLPNGQTIEGRGILPDRELASDWWRFSPSDDPQVVAALEELGAQPGR